MNIEDVHKCAKCGLCLINCPVYKEVLDESNSPRAKIQLIKHYAEHDLASSKNLNELVSKCLMCGNCTAACPSGVRHDSLFMRMRARMVEDFSENWHMRVVYHLLTRESRLDLAVKFAKLGHNAVLKKLAREYKVGNIPIKRLPLFNHQPFRRQVEEITRPVSSSKGTVLYFTGCGTHYVYEDIGRAAVHVLTRMGYEVEIPKDQLCCGLPMFFHGNLQKARANIERNIRIFDRPDVEAVVVDCATCGAAMREEWIEVLKELGADTGPAERLAAKVKDISEFVFDRLELLLPQINPDASPLTTTYHSPCHLRNDRGVQNPIEALLKNIPNIRYRRSVDFDACCGGGGTFFMDFPEISKRIVDKKIANARETGAEILATGCPGCRLNLSGNIDDGDKLRVLHPIQIVSACI